MEFGPRALGNRSILASPLNPYSTENLNIYIKHREPFRKFAASVPAELARSTSRSGANARFLATVGRVRPEHRKTFESAVLGDGLVRVHTVDEDENRSSGGCCTRPARQPACRCCTTRRSTCSAIRWFAAPAMRSEASIPPASTRCSWATSSCRSSPLLRVRKFERACGEGHERLGETALGPKPEKDVLGSRGVDRGQVRYGSAEVGGRQVRQYQRE